nr:unnamed protein product [Callosobruchus chinensis]
MQTFFEIVYNSFSIWAAASGRVAIPDNRHHFYMY